MSMASISWEDAFTRPKQSGLYAGIFAFPGEKPLVFGGSLAQRLAYSNDETSFLIFPFAQNDALPGMELPLQATTQIESLSPDWMLKDPWEGTEPFWELSHGGYAEMVEKACQNFDATFQKAMLCRRWKIQQGPWPVRSIWERFRKLYPNTLTWFLTCPVAGSWMGASPETLLNQEGERVESLSLAGTRSASGRQAWTPKEQEEQALVTQHIHHEMLGFGVEKLTTTGPEELAMGDLRHLSTRLVGELPRQVSSEALRLARQLHPTPAVGGTPSPRALAFIRETEAQSRGYYAGFLGLSEPSQRRLRLFVNLRCIEYRKNGSWIFAGAGLTAASIPAEEARETERKAQLVRTCFEPE